MDLLRLQDVEAFYGESQALFGVSLQVPEGMVVGLLGRNGAGKTTTLKAVMGLVKVARGSITFQDRELRGKRPFEIARLGISYVPEDRRVFRNLTVLENLRLAARSAPGDSRWRTETVLELFPPLKPLVRRPAGFLSGGEQQMLSIARGLMMNPKLMLLDEPFEGLAPTIVNALRAALMSMRSAGVTIIVCEQNLKSLSGLVDTVHVLDKGRVSYSGPLLELEADEELMRRLLAV
jgi:branched-chain amino acid transport system ATP-binding protein